MTGSSTEVSEPKFAICIEIWQVELEDGVWRVSFHKYAYVHGDPIQGIDPTGKFLEALWTRVQSDAENLAAFASARLLSMQFVVQLRLTLQMVANPTALVTLIQRFLWDPRVFKNISNQYWRP